ncbi:hypothetical protein QQF64_011232 [Cirrhinus molitorella]|uniref:Gypsy retrotransposon integrase-like protein 1 n=1 Tax=Cirrhinus molitorella TaxID=172907 RepID=A0ABR3M2U3_9TELE
MWLDRGAVNTGKGWRSADGCPVIPPKLMKSLLAEAHGLAHVGSTQMVRALSHWWHPYLQVSITNFLKECTVCVKNNAKPTIKPHAGTFPLRTGPGEEVVIDFTDMGTRVQGKRYLLVLVDSYTGWPEAWPTKAEDSQSVVKCLINQYIP